MSDFESHFAVWNLSGQIAHVNCGLFTRNLSSHVACNFNCFIETDSGLFKVTGSHIHCKGGNISETVQDRSAFNVMYLIRAF